MANGSVEYNMGHLKADMENVVRRLDKLEAKVSDMNVWRWKVVGAVSVLALGGNTVFEILKTNI